MRRRLILASAIALVLAAAVLPGSGVGSSATVARHARLGIPAGLADAIHARFGARAIRSRSTASPWLDTDLGLAVALSADGTTALVGAPGVASRKGAAYIFHASDAGSWSSSGKPVATLTKNHGSSGDEFGTAVALSADGTTAFVGAPTAGTKFRGAIYVFHASAEDAWASSSTPAATLTASFDSYDLYLGESLALSPDGTTLVVGAPFYSDEGEAFVFHVASEDAWVSTSTPTATLSNSAVTEDGRGVGRSVAISADGTTALVSDDENPDGGEAYVYHVSAADAWTSSSTPTAILSDPDSNADAYFDYFGNALALSGDGTLAVIASLGADSNAGAVHVFHASGEAAWASTSTPTATLTDATVAWGPGGDEELEDYFVRVAVSADGTSVLVLAPGVNTTRGAAYIFHASSEGAWASSSTPTATLTRSGGHTGDFLGVGMLSPDGATALIGAHGVRSGTGAAYIFHVSDATSWVSNSIPNATLTNDALAACVVPKLKGLKLRAAGFKLLLGRCDRGKVTRVYSTPRHRGRVLSQNRKPGKRLAIGAKVGVRVGK